MPFKPLNKRTKQTTISRYMRKTGQLSSGLLRYRIYLCTAMVGAEGLMFRQFNQMPAWQTENLQLKTI